MQDIIYLHGFLSSPQSEKAQQTLRFAKRHYPALNIHTPQLSGNIENAISTVESLVRTLLNQGKPLLFIGSSMGGFLATYFVETYSHKAKCRAVIVNPAVKPYELLQDYMGQHVNPYSKEVFYIHHQSIADLHRFDKPMPQRPETYMVLLQTGDETLDYRQAAQKYQNSRLIVEQGGDHSFQNFDAHLPHIFAFLRGDSEG